MNEFTEFKRCFTKYQKALGLTGYKVYFKQKPMKEYFASITVRQHDMVATVTLSNSALKKHRQFRDVKCNARHEIGHLLASRLEDLARYRYVNEDQIYEASEEIANKVEKLLGEKGE